MSDRLDSDDLYAGMAFLYARRSTCLRGHVGVVIVQNRRLVGGGYNGAPSGLPHCLDEGCDMHLGPIQGCQRAIHAEANAIAWAARQGVAIEGATMYSTHAPCKACAQLIAAAKIARFVYTKDYRAQRLDILAEAGVDIDHVPFEDVP